MYSLANHRQDSGFYVQPYSVKLWRNLNAAALLAAARSEEADLGKGPSTAAAAPASDTSTN